MGCSSSPFGAVTVVLLRPVATCIYNESLEEILADDGSIDIPISTTTRTPLTE